MMIWYLFCFNSDVNFSIRWIENRNFITVGVVSRFQLGGRKAGMRFGRRTYRILILRRRNRIKIGW